MDQFFTGIVFPTLVVLPIALLIMIQPDNSTTIILMGIVFSMLFIGGAKLMQFFTTILLGASSMLIFIINQIFSLTSKVNCKVSCVSCLDYF